MQKVVMLKDLRERSAGDLVEIENNEAAYLIDSGYAKLYFEVVPPVEVPARRTALKVKKVKKVRKNKMMTAGRSRAYNVKGI